MHTNKYRRGNSFADSTIPGQTECRQIMNIYENHPMACLMFYVL